MPRTFRRFVTGNNDAGRSVLVDGSEVQETGGTGNFNFWRTAPEGVGCDASTRFPFFPRGGETIFRLFRIPPDGPSMSKDDVEHMAAGFFAELGDPSCKVDTRRHPLMHRTPTVDYIMLLSGSAALLLDEGEPILLKPFDSVVQRGTNHMWLNVGAEDAVFLAVMVGTADRDGR